MRRLAILATVAMCVGFSFAAQDADRALMSDAYWKIWNDAEQARIDADIERNRKADGRAVGRNAADDPRAARHDGEDWPVVNAQLAEAVSRIPNAALVSSEGLEDCRDDLIHFETPSLRRFGERYAEAMFKVQGGVSCSFDFIDLDKDKTCQAK